MKMQCKDCGKPCTLEFPGNTEPEVCPFPDEEGAHYCSWAEIKDRRKKT
jgi:hypothetical protein